jgi:hypothetical protein
MDVLRGQLKESLDRESTTEIDRMLRGITSAFEPYQRFYEAESGKIERFADKLTKIEAEAKEIQLEVERRRPAGWPGGVPPPPPC